MRAFEGLARFCFPFSDILWAVGILIPWLSLHVYI